jgi:hypothetical protein
MRVLRKIRNFSCIFEVHTIDIGNRQKETFRALLEAIEEATSDDWDGYSASAVDLRSINQALSLLQVLPTSIPSPEISVEPDGKILLEWYTKPQRTFAISVGYDGGLIYAGIFWELVEFTSHCHATRLCMLGLTS